MPVENTNSGEDVAEGAISGRQFADLQNRFTYHAPKGDQISRYGHLRVAALALALEIAETTPVSREQSLAFTHLEEAIFWANASIARNE